MAEYWNPNDPYEKGFADKLYENDIPQYIVPAPNGNNKQAPKKKKKKRNTFLIVILSILCSIFVLIFALIGFLYFYSERPNDVKGHKDGVATILIAGTDESGLRTDTLMLLCADRDQGRINLMSIPRDTRVDSTYQPHKINLAYQCNGEGEEGMYWLMDYVRQCVGFRPDGYILVDLDCIVELVELFGGIEFDVPCEMKHSEPEDDLYIDLQPGMQRLNGKEAMWVVRFRSGYAMADLQRVNVQRDFMFAAIKQWLSVKNISKFSDALDILEKYCITDLNTRNFMWLGWSALLCGTSDAKTVTMPYTLSGSYVYIDADEDYVDLINKYFNPYTKKVRLSDMNIVPVGE